MRQELRAFVDGLAMEDKLRWDRVAMVLLRLPGLKTCSNSKQRSASSGKSLLPLGASCKKKSCEPHLASRESGIEPTVKDPCAPSVALITFSRPLEHAGHLPLRSASRSSRSTSTYLGPVASVAQLAQPRGSLGVSVSSVTKCPLQKSALSF